MQDQFTLDFGSEELNDPNYEQNVDAGGTPDGTTTDAPTDAQRQTSGGAEAAPDAQQQQQPKQDGAQAGTGSADDKQGQQQPAGDGQQPASARAKQDDKGNLVDAQGNIIARAGAERRQYERVQAQDRYIKRLEGELNTAKEGSVMANVLNGAPQQLGLDMNEVQMGLQAIASFKKDPVSTARWMLQETMRLGYNLQQIIGADAQGQLNGGSLDLAAVKSMISEAVGPMLQDRQAQQQQSQVEQEAQREYDRFLANHDHANVHEDVLASMIRANPSTTPEVAYWQLREYATKNQLDFTQPLRAQVAARQQGGQPQPNGNAAQQSQQQQPMPNGGGVPQQDMQQQSVYNDADDAWDTIVNQSLREAGMMQ